MIQDFSTEIVSSLLDEARASVSARNFEAAAQTLQAASAHIDRLATIRPFQHQGDSDGNNS
jgi:hypothetical protein